MPSVSKFTKRKRQLDTMLEAAITVTNHVVVDATNLLWELKQLQYEVGQYPQLDVALYKKLLAAIQEIGTTDRKVEDGIEHLRTRLTRMIKFFNRKFDRQLRNRERTQVNQPQGKEAQ
jgi:hypothetical protein